MRTLMHVKHASYSMTRSMTIVKSCRPQILPSKNIHMPSSDSSSLRPDNSFQVENAHEHSGVCFLLELGGGLVATEMSGPGDVCGPVKILPARVQEVDLIVVQWHALGGTRGVVNDCTVGANRRNTFEGESLEKIILLLQILKYQGTRPLSQPMILFPQFLLQKGEISHDTSTISYIGISHAFLLGLVLHGFKEIDAFLLVYKVVFDNRMQSCITLCQVSRYFM